MLTALVGDAQAEAFGSGWPCKPLAHHGPLGRVPPLAALAKVDRDALATRPCARRMLLDRDDDGWITTRDVDAERARSEALRTICQAKTEHHEIDGWLAEFAEELGVSRVAVFTNTYLSRGGAHTGMHYDCGDAFIVQLHGSKRWRHTSQQLLPRHNFAPPAAPPPELYRRYPDAITAALDTAEELVLEPGGVLFLPRGCWHATEAVDDGVTLGIKVMPFDWAELVCRYLDAHLTADPRWGARAIGVFGQHIERAQRELSELLADLATTASSLDAESILRACNLMNDIPRRGEEWLVRRPAVVLFREGNDVVAIGPDGSRVSQSVDGDASALLRWLLQQQRFRRSDALANAGTLSSEAVATLLDDLIIAGALAEV